MVKPLPRRTVVLLLLWFCFAWWCCSTNAQLSVRSVSSFQKCVAADQSLPGAISLNCTTVDGSVQKVTALQLSLTPGLSTGSAFTLDLSTVLDVVGDGGVGSNTTSSDPTQCNPNAPSFQNCIATRTATMSVRTSRPVFTYSLRRITDFEVPYCYMSVTTFEDIVENFDATLAGGSPSGSATTAGNVPCYSSSDMSGSLNACGGTTYDNMQNTDRAVMCALNTGHGISMRESNGRATNRYQRPFPFADSQVQQFRRRQVPGTSSSEQRYLYLRGATERHPYVFTTSNQAAIAPGEYRYYLDFDFYEGDENNTECAANRCQGNVYDVELHTNQRDYDLCCYGNRSVCDSPNVDVRVPTLYPMPNPFGFGPHNLYEWWNSSESKYYRDPGIDHPLSTVWKSESRGYPSTLCAAPTCAANTDNRRVLYLESDKFKGLMIGTSYKNSKHTSLALPPTCAVYRVTPDPEVQMQVSITVNTQVAKGVNRTQTVNINNFAAGGGSSSEELLVRARITNIQSVDSALGPSMDGYIVQCGRQRGDDVMDMRELLMDDPVHGDVNDIPITANPWDRVVKRFKEDVAPILASITDDDDNDGPHVFDSTHYAGGERKYFFPHPFDYVKAGTRGKNASYPGMGTDYGQTFWYFVPEDVAIREFGGSCNQVGMPASFAASPANRAEVCQNPAHECTPGIGRFANGGRKTSLPCTVSGLFNRASGALPARTRAQGKVDRAFLSKNSIFDTTLEDAKMFMPGDTFARETDRRTNRAPGTGPSQRLYTPEKPNAWLADNKLVFEQPGSKKAVSAAITADIQIEFVGSFVSYEDVVSKGEIVYSSNSTCHMVSGDSAVITAHVKNVASVTTGVATTYRLSMNCNTSATGLQVAAPDGGAYVVGPIGPEGESAPQLFTINQNGDAAPQSDSFCTLVLSSETDVILDPVMDTQKITCTVQPPDAPPVFVPPNATDNPVTTAPCVRSCGMCHLEDGTWYQSWCILLFLSILFGLMLMFATSIVLGIALAIKFKTQAGRDERKSSSIMSDYLGKRDAAQQAAAIMAAKQGLVENPSSQENEEDNTS